MTQQRLENMVRLTRNLADRLEEEVNSREPLDVKVETFIREITQTLIDYSLDALVRSLMRWERRRVNVNQEIDTVGPGAIVIGAKTG